MEKVKVACAFPVSPTVENHRGINGPDWINGNRNRNPRESRGIPGQSGPDSLLVQASLGTVDDYGGGDRVNNGNLNVHPNIPIVGKDEVGVRLIGNLSYEGSVQDPAPLTPQYIWTNVPSRAPRMVLGMQSFARTKPANTGGLSKGCPRPTD